MTLLAASFSSGFAGGGVVSTRLASTGSTGLLGSGGRIDAGGRSELRFFLFFLAMGSSRSGVLRVVTWLGAAGEGAEAGEGSGRGSLGEVASG